MKQKNRLASRLYLLTTIAFYGAALFAAYIIVWDLFITPTDSFFTVPNHNYGYTVPVKIQLNQASDSTLTYHNADRSRSGVISTAKHYDAETRELFYSRLKDSSYTKTLTVDMATMYGDHKVINNEFGTIRVMSSEGQLILNPKNIGLKLLLAIKNYLYMIVMLYVLWQSRLFFKPLMHNFSFSKNVSRKLWIVGNAILCYQLLNWVLCLIIERFYWHVKVESLQPGTGNRTEMYTLYPDTEFNLGLVILSLSLIVISRLLDYGNDLQEENELTI
ncbi:MAG: hypothetical protein DI539_02345 [Flavobacterium psychrophilum]|nr:MAG: hypothetical protein DI539_02345 [Flavobacterium psychrophilum]